MAGMIYVMGIALSRLMVLLLGALIARQLGHDDYAQFVLFLAASNLLTNLSLMGVVPRILSLPRGEDGSLIPLQLGGFLSFILTFLCALSLVIFGGEGLEKFAGQKPWITGIAMLLYSGGYFCLSLASALQNRLGLHAQAGFAWAIFALLSLVVGGGVVFFHDYLFFLLALSACTAIMGTGLWLKESQAWGIFQIKVSTIRDTKARLQASLAGMLQSIYSGLFGFPFLLVFFLIGQKINLMASSSDKAVFFLGFQLFAVTLFMPGVLGNIFVPRLSQVIQAEKRALMRRLSRLYLILGLGWVLCVYLILPALFEVYAIENSHDAMTMILIWQFAGVLAAVGALHNQLLVANRRYSVLLLGSALWAIIVYACIWMFGVHLVWGSVIGILVAYTVLQLFYRYKNADHWSHDQESPANLIYFLANPYSPHVRHWEELLQLGGYSIQIYSAQLTKAEGMPLLVNAPVKTMLPSLARYLPALLRYGLAGLRLRFSKLPVGGCLHAHNTSGYGLMALLSGKPYILTTYGSEIFKAGERGRFYSFLIRMILKRATRVTSASASMTACLKEQFKLPVAKIYEFNLGVSAVFSFNATERFKRREAFHANDEPIWMINRRVRPLYHTLEVMEAFIRFRECYGLGHLLVLEGDSDPLYFKAVENYASQNTHIHLLSGFFSQEDLAAFLSAADFSISVPETDQVSCSILESAACGAIPLLSALEGYQPLLPLSRQFPIQNPNNSFEYDEIFRASYRLFCGDNFLKLREKILERIQPFKLHYHLPKIRLLYKHCEQNQAEYNTDYHGRNDPTFFKESEPL